MADINIPLAGSNRSDSQQSDQPNLHLLVITKEEEKYHLTNIDSWMVDDNSLIVNQTTDGNRGCFIFPFDSLKVIEESTKEMIGDDTRPLFKLSKL